MYAVFFRHTVVTCWARGHRLVHLLSCWPHILRLQSLALLVFYPPREIFCFTFGFSFLSRRSSPYRVEYDSSIDRVLGLVPMHCVRCTAHLRALQCAGAQCTCAV